jgi:hypothetical protein
MLDQTPHQPDDACETSRRISQISVEIPATVAGYEILKCLGNGSFGTVWLARERRTGRQVAIKFFTNRRGLDWTLLTREVEKLAVLDASRDVVRLLDVGVDHDPPYFVMEYLPHRSVAHLLEAGALPVPQSIEIARSVARALVHAHNAGILHCDVKPGNVLLDRGNAARLGDFGQSRLTSDRGASLGTFYYMAPEQAAASAVPDVRWDVYALGALLYHMLTGGPPYRTEESEERLRNTESLSDRLQAYRQIVLESQFPNDHRAVPGVDAPLAALIDGCLARDPAERTPNPQVILDTLEKRDLARAQRPLIWLGFLGPVLFFLMLLWIGRGVVSEAVGQAENHLSQRALASNMATARLLAAGIQQEMTDRQSELERLARRLSAPAGDSGFNVSQYGLRSDLMEVLDRWRDETDERLRKQHRTLDESFFLTDQNGVQIYRSPWKDSIGQSFSYRDYFHGLGRELEPGDTAQQIKPRTTSGISIPFRSSNTGQFMVAVAVPVWNRENTQVVGVLARTIHLSDLLQQWEENITTDESRAQNPEGERMLSLVDMREDPPLVLDHHWIQDGKSAELRSELEMKEKLRLTPAEEHALRRALSTGQGMTDYQDPMADVVPEYRGIWLAAPALASGLNWVAIVQERYQAAVQPMHDLYWIFLRYGLVLAVLFAAMLLLLWWLIQRAAVSHEF